MKKPSRSDLERIQNELKEMSDYIASQEDNDGNAGNLYANLLEASDYLGYALDLQIDDYEKGVKLEEGT